MTADELSAAAKAMRRDWDSPGLWPAIERRIREDERARRRYPWKSLAAAAVVILSVAASLVLLGNRLLHERAAPVTGASRLLSDEGLSDVERAEAQYIAAIEALAAKVARTDDLTRPTSLLLANLRERLVVIDAAIADCRAEIERNRFNTHLRRQLLSIYQEKRRTLEQILDEEQHAS